MKALDILLIKVCENLPKNKTFLKKDDRCKLPYTNTCKYLIGKPTIEYSHKPCQGDHFMLKGYKKPVCSKVIENGQKVS